MLIALAALALSLPQSDPLLESFRNPPPSARPHTWWHWMDGNITKEGITADLEAMKKVGIGGAQMFTVAQGIPTGPAGYMSPLWREMTTHAIKEAGRLGIELCIHNCAGWSSSGAPWVEPADAMQVLAWSEVKIEGPRNIRQQLPPLKAPYVVSEVPYSKDIAVYAFPSRPDLPRSAQFLERTGVTRGDRLDIQPTTLPAGTAIPKTELIDLTGKLGKDGTLEWDVPDGNWTILRMGHVPTGKDNHPAPPEGDGLEVDKLSKEALDRFWAGGMAKVIADAGPLAGKVLNNSLVDSYEVGSQNWTPKFREEFLKRRGYGPLPFLPAISGRVIESSDITERFLWDFRRTIADLYADNYYGHFGDLCHKAGMLFSTEPYGNGGFDNIQAGSKADILMGEFWIGGMAMESTKLAASAGHVYGRQIIGAESFTADDVRGRWLEEPYAQKALGDLAFVNGVNRYIFHRYAHQPWMNLRPGMTMGPWGTHLERTQTWWNEAGTWLQYVARCQQLLQSGRFVADVCYYTGEEAPVDLGYGTGLQPTMPQGYDYDGCDAQALRSMFVRNGRVVLPSGMSYSVLVLPNRESMTPAMARKIRDLVSAGATVLGPKPLRSPSLVGYPASENELKSIVEDLWGPGDSKEPGQRRFGRGRIAWGMSLGEVLKSINVAPDFDFTPRNYGTKLLSIHRKIGDAEVYFVSNQNYRPTAATATFRVRGRLPELWHADTGHTEPAVAFSEAGGLTSIPLTLQPAESVFVVFRKPASKVHLTSFGPRAEPVSTKAPRIEIESARYESEDGRGADVTAKVREMVQGGEAEIPASNNLFGDPVVNVVKRLVITYKLDGKTMKQTAPENDSVTLLKMASMAVGAPGYTVKRSGERQIQVVAWKPTVLEMTTSTGQRQPLSFTEQSASLDLSRSWNVTFPPNLGAPASAAFDRLISWPQHKDNGIRYFSGTATYRKEFSIPTGSQWKRDEVRLDLGHVKNFATVTLNGRKVATLWKPPFVVDVTSFVKPGKNSLEVQVTNLWPNRLIGDEQLPPDVEWNGVQLKGWPEWLAKGLPRPKTGRIGFTTWKFWNKSSPLLESGLLGPVRLETARGVVIGY